jgi:hypothetical protein
MTPVYFYLPSDEAISGLPKTVTDFRTDLAKVRHSEHSWILQTYLQLQQVGFPCELTREIPDEGMIIAHRTALNYDFMPSSKQLLACVKADQNPHPYAQVHIVQNQREVSLPEIYIQCKAEDRYLLPGKRHYLPHWPQPNLLPRDPNRKDTFKRIAYFGISANLDPALTDSSWQEMLNEMGLEWVTYRDRSEWSNYSEVDAVVAVRKFADTCDYSWKPASKLFNAWNARVPALLGAESAYQMERKSDLDYFEVSTVENLLLALKRLRDDPQLRQDIEKNCFLRSQEISPESIAKKWQDFILNTCQAAQEKWQGLSSLERNAYFLRRRMALSFCRLQKILASN